MIPGDAPAVHLAMAAALDVVPDHVVVLSDEGRILHTNAAWRRFAAENGDRRDWDGVDYLAAGGASPDATPGEDDDPMGHGLRDVLTGRLERYEHDYACHAPDEMRWFRMTATRVDVDGVGAVVAHSDVSHARSSVQALGRRAMHDPATGALTAEAIEGYARQMVAEGRGVTVVRVLLEDPGTPDVDAELARAAARLLTLFPDPAAVGHTDRGLIVVQGGESDADLLETLGRTYATMSGDFPHLRVSLTGERRSQGEHGVDGDAGRGAAAVRAPGAGAGEAAAADGRRSDDGVAADGVDATPADASVISPVRR